MGQHFNVGISRFPLQGELVGREINVCFDYDTSKVITGRCVRDDIGDPGVAIFELADGRFVLSTECQYRVKN
jgi:hypothetical protein